MTRTALSERVTSKFFLDEFKKHYVGRIYLSNMRREFHNLKQRQMSVTEYQREFIRLSKYAPEILVSEKEKCIKLLVYGLGLNRIETFNRSNRLVRFLKH